MRSTVEHDQYQNAENAQYRPVQALSKCQTYAVAHFTISIKMQRNQFRNVRTVSVYQNTQY